MDSYYCSKINKFFSGMGSGRPNPYATALDLPNQRTNHEIILRAIF